MVCTGVALVGGQFMTKILPQIGKQTQSQKVVAELSWNAKSLGINFSGVPNARKHKSV